MTDHEQPAAGVADYRNFPGHSMCCRCVSCENANRNRDLWFPGDPPRAPTDAGGAVSEGGRGKSRGQVAYEGWSMGLPGCEWANQTRTQKRAWEASAAAVLNAAPAPQPLQQGGEITRADLGDLAGLVERIEQGGTSCCGSDGGEGYRLGQEAARAIRSLAADRDKAVGLLRRLLDFDRTDAACVPTDAHCDLQEEADAFLSSQTEGS